MGLIVILGVLRGHGRSQMVAGAVILLFAGGFVVWLGAGKAIDRFESYRKLEVSESRRAEMLKDSWRIFLDHPVAGTGLGTLEDVFPRYETLYDGTIVNHTHNDYVEALAETGVIGGIICAGFLVILFRTAWARIARAKNPLDLALHIGALSACCAVVGPQPRRFQSAHSLERLFVSGAIGSGHFHNTCRRRELSRGALSETNAKIACESRNSDGIIPPAWDRSI